MNKKRTSPIKEKTLRHPGQSLDEKIFKLITEDVISYYFMGLGFILLAGYEWLRYYLNSPPNPVLSTLLAITVSPYCAYKLLTIYKETRLIKQGRDGERAVGQYLENLRADGCVVFHDIVADNFNLDHVVVSKKGIYTIETKTYSKPEKGEAKILFDGEKLSIQGAGTYNRPVIQVNAAATWLKNTLEASTGKTFKVKPVILFPGWFVESTAQGKKSNTWVLNPKALPVYMKNQTEMLSQEDTQMAVFHLCRYVRVKEADKM